MDRCGWTPEHQVAWDELMDELTYWECQVNTLNKEHPNFNTALATYRWVRYKYEQILHLGFIPEYFL
ncbi:hypothetical protein EV182_002618 [Spiromyces aspiralis]|uniref:Uncharacterized protein n=1 Tax=Spiromyces aspiralis TaxID=68401 RepID=A0ACC1HGI9_9FUNG|nr:hypothetical protein EV182_002618 [Spiromyces aspiralis]